MSQSAPRQQPRYPYQANQDRIIIEANFVEDIPFGRKANEDCEEGISQTEPDECFQQGAHVVPDIGILRNGTP